VERVTAALLAPDTRTTDNQDVTDEGVLKEELSATMDARKELGDEMEPAVIDAFVARIEQRLGDRADERERALKRRRDHQKEMTLGAMAISIPLFAIAAIFTGLAGVVTVCVALAVIAIVSARAD
jgi:hypothetical protein